MKALFVLTVGTAIAFGAQAANSQPSDDPRVADLVHAGKLRAGIGIVAPHWAIKKPQTGEVHGVAVDVARALAARLGVKLIVVEYPSPPRVLEGIKSGAWDVGFLGVDATRAAVVDFSPPYLQIDATYLVPESSSIRGLADADKSGVRIAVSAKSVEDIVLSGMLKRAEIRRVETVGAGLELLRAGNADVLAVPRPTALRFATQLPGSRVLDDRFHACLLYTSPSPRD